MTSKKKTNGQKMGSDTSIHGKCTKFNLCLLFWFYGFVCISTSNLLL